MQDTVWTDRMLNIPKTIAAKYVRYGYQEYDELLSIGYLAMIMAVRNYDPLRSDSLPAYVYWCVSKRVVEALRKLRRCDTRYQQISSSNHLTYTPTNRLDITDFLQRVLSVLSERDKECLMLSLGYDLTQKEISQRFSVSQPRITVVIRNALQKVREAALQELEGHSYELASSVPHAIRDTNTVRATNVTVLSENMEAGE